MSIHELKFLPNRGVRGIDGPASRFRWDGGIVVRWEDDEAGWDILVWEIEEVRYCCTGTEQRKIGGRVNVSVNIYNLVRESHLLMILCSAEIWELRSKVFV